MDWGTKIFNFGRHEVKNFLVANALYWLERYHIDGLRVDAVASMLYLDYSRKAGEWMPNKYGGRENLEALEFLREFNTVAHREHPGRVDHRRGIHRVPRRVAPRASGRRRLLVQMEHGVDERHAASIRRKDPVYRRHEHSKITFSFVYAWTENFILPISHDEVVHGKKSLLDKMPGDEWQKRANYRLFLGVHDGAPGQETHVHGLRIRPVARMARERAARLATAAESQTRGLQDLNRELARLYRELAAVPRQRLRPGRLPLGRSAQCR